MAAEIPAQISGATAEDRWHIDATRNCQPGARACFRRVHDKFFVLRDESCVTGRKILVADTNGKRATTPRYDALIVKAETQISQRSFQTRGCVFVAGQRIRSEQTLMNTPT